MPPTPLIDLAATVPAKLEAIKHVTWICESLRYFGWAALLLGGGVFLTGLARFLEVFRPRP